MVGHGGSSAGSYLANPTSPIPSHCASIVVTSTLRVIMLSIFHAMSAKSSVLKHSMQLWLISYNEVRSTKNNAVQKQKT